MNELRHQIETGAKSAPAGPQVAYVTIDEGADGQRIDNFLLKVSKGVPKSHIYRVLRSGEVRVNKGRVDATYRLQIGDVVRIPPMRVAEASQPPAGRQYRQPISPYCSRMRTCWSSTSQPV